jgi:hypothetical protein
MYIIAIPSYKRAELLKLKTLSVLQKYKIPRTRIYIFVADKDEEKIYTETIPIEMYGKIIVGERGLKNQRNFISKFFPKGQEIVNMDDDIAGFNYLAYKSKSLKKSLKKSMKLNHGENNENINNKYNAYLRVLENLDLFFKNGFKSLKQNNLFLWGIYPINNAYFMSPKMTLDLRLIVGPCWGNINRHDTDLILTIDEKEDVERTLQYYVKDRGVIRFNNISVQTTYYSTKGGMQSFGRDRKKDALESAEYLNKKYPKLTKLYLTKKSGVAEVRLKDINIS